MIILSGLGASFILIGNFKSIIVGFGLLIVVALIIRRWIKTVKFDENGITVLYFFSKTKVVRFDECKEFYKSNDGILPAPVNVIKCKVGSPVKKIIFVCDEERLIEICDDYFNGFRPKTHHK